MQDAAPGIPYHVLRLLMGKPYKELNGEELQSLFPHLAYGLLMEFLWKLKDLGFGTTTVAMYVLATSLEKHPVLISVCSSTHTVSVDIMKETLRQWREDNPEFFQDSECSQVHAGAASEEDVIDADTEVSDESDVEVSDAEVSDASDTDDTVLVDADAC